MMNKLTHILSIVFLSTLIASCDSNQETHQKSLEEKLVDSFAQEDKPTRDRVSLIVSASNDKNYAKAMNELAMLSANHLNNKEQDNAIRQLMVQLRFNIDEAELAVQEQAIQP